MKKIEWYEAKDFAKAYLAALESGKTPADVLNAYQKFQDNMQFTPIIRAMYALSGDPPTNGHAWVVNEINKFADEIHIGLAVNPDKKFMFDIDQRVVMMRAITSHINKRVCIHNIENEFLVKYAKHAGCTHLIRGIRSVKDYEYEKSMAMINSDLEPEITTLFLFPPPSLEAVSSSFVKGLIGLEDWQTVAAKYVHPYVLKYLTGEFKLHSS